MKTLTENIPSRFANKNTPLVISNTNGDGIKKKSMCNSIYIANMLNYQWNYRCFINDFKRN